MGNFFSLYAFFRFLFSELSNISVYGFGSFIFKYAGKTCHSILLLKEDIALICASQGLFFLSKSLLLLPHRLLDQTNTR